ncbi:MAG: hypothetical protein B7Z71_08265 [Acidocella sp. 21-58-7]|nr:MAG: hypothetical protein B7Z71_08265 [Acidocella sp. 21-58-7]
MASFNGADLGYVRNPGGGPIEKGYQENEYPGVDGTERLDMGARGWRWTFEAWIVGPDLPTFAGYKTLLQSFQVAGASGAGMFVDPDGNAHMNVICKQIAFKGDRVPIPGGGVAQMYDAEFVYDGR